MASVGFVSSLNIPKGDLIVKYGQNKYTTYSALMGHDHIPLATQEQMHQTYSQQIQLYGLPGELEFKPFNVLKANGKNAKDFCAANFATSEIFRSVSNDEGCIVDLKDEQSCANGAAFYERMTTQKHMEGIVVKPDLAYVAGVAPYMKVRSVDYMMLIYGYDYLSPKKYARLMRQKKIKYKLKTSIMEYDCGQRMLEVPYAEITENNMLFMKLAANMIIEEKREVRLDPRL
jgi:hypothetical protein